MGVMIGIYGNWIIAVLDKISDAGLIQTGLFFLSFFPLIFYFMEVFTDFDKQTRFGKHSHRLIPIIGIFHIILVYSSLFIAELVNNQNVFVMSGVFLWSMLMFFEWTGFVRQKPNL